MNEAPRLVVNNDEEVIAAKPARQEPPPSDWLSGMKAGTEFLCRDKTMRYFPRWVALEYTHGGMLEPKPGIRNVLLIPTKTMQDVKTWQWVDPLEFCMIFEFRGIIEEP